MAESGTESALWLVFIGGEGDGEIDLYTTLLLKCVSSLKIYLAHLGHLVFFLG